jgi:hypothetical protein
VLTAVVPDELLDPLDPVDPVDPLDPEEDPLDPAEPLVLELVCAVATELRWAVADSAGS